MSLYRKAKPGELVHTPVHKPAETVHKVVHKATSEQRKAYRREWMRTKRAKAKQDAPPADLKDIWLLTAELG